MKRLALLLVIVLLAVSAGFAIAQTIPPQTLTKKRIVIQNIERCREGRSTLVGRGPFDPDKRKHPKYVCRTR